MKEKHLVFEHTVGHIYFKYVCRITEMIVMIEKSVTTLCFPFQLRTYTKFRTNLNGVWPGFITTNVAVDLRN